MNALHVELDRIHDLDISAPQLQLASDLFQNFTQIWSDIVTKISDLLNSLSMQGTLIRNPIFNFYHFFVFLETHQFVRCKQ